MSGRIFIFSGPFNLTLPLLIKEYSFHFPVNTNQNVEGVSPYRAGAGHMVGCGLCPASVPIWFHTGFYANEGLWRRKLKLRERLMQIAGFSSEPPPTHFRRVFLITTRKGVAGVKSLSRDYNHKAKDWLVAISHGGLGNDSSVTQYPDPLPCPGCKAPNSL